MLADDQSRAGALVAELRERALAATGTSITISDPTLPDSPLIWVNPAFTRTTGYSYDDAVGRNCRFLQGPGTDRDAVAEVHRLIQLGEPFTATLLNYRKDGTPFWNEMAIAPIRDGADGAITHYVGVQTDVTARHEAQQARDDALDQAARAAERLALLADFTSQLATCRQPQQVVELLADVLVPRVGTWALIFTTDETGHLAVANLRHERADADPAVRGLLDEFRAVVADQLQSFGPVGRVLRREEPYVLIPDFDAAPSAVTGAAYDDRTSLARKLGLRSVLVVPLAAGSGPGAGIAGSVTVVTDADRPPLSRAELALARDLSVRAGLMLENTTLAARTRAAAAALQLSMLPRVPTLPGVEVAAAYVPAADEAAVGGDWYDVFALRDGGVGVAVGDVMGHNMDSAARMGKLSTVLRAYAWPGLRPAEVLTAVDELLEGGDLPLLATCLYATLTPLERGGAELRYSSAGHPPGVVKLAEGDAVELGDGRGPMLGVSALLREGAERPDDAVIELRPGATLVFFTDGLVDAYGAEPDTTAGLAEIRRLVAALPQDASPQQIVDDLVGAGRRHVDDVAVVALRIS